MFRRKSTRAPPQKQEDPFRRINNWDDGYEYIRDKPSPPPAGYTAPFYSPPMTSRNPYEAEPPRSRRHQDAYTKHRNAYPSPPSSSDRDHRRHRRRSPSPQPYRTRSPSPPPRRRDYYEQREPLSRSKSMREPPRERHRSPSSILPGGRLHRQDREPRSRRAYSPSPSPSPTRHRRRSPSPIRRQKTREFRPEPREARPNLSRSKSTSAKERLPGLSPRWQAAAAAALQAGSMAALNARSQPGAWAGEKGARVATAALGAAAMNAFQKGQEKGEGKTKGGSSKGGNAKSRRNSGVEALGGVLGGFLMDQMKKRK